MDKAYPTTGFTVELRRSPAPFYTNTYLPTGLLTLASFIGFVIPVEIVPGRMALLVTTFLMLVNIKSTERYVGPVVSSVDKFIKILSSLPFYLHIFRLEL